MIEISCDLGEALTEEALALEAELWPLVDAANVACGGHVGNAESMQDAIVLARFHGVILGAHPSYPDREFFGRRTIEIDHDQLVRSLVEQIGTLREIARAEDVPLARVKPHGALYNDAHHDIHISAAIIEAIEYIDTTLALVAAPGSQLIELADAAGLPTIREAFADRRYCADGSLKSRSEEGSVLLDFDQAAHQASALAQQHKVVADDGTVIEIDFDTLCVHGDMEGAAERLRRIRVALGRG